MKVKIPVDQTANRYGVDEFITNFNKIFEIIALTSDKNSELMREVINCLREIGKEPEWRQHLIDKTFVYDDGKRVKGNLNEVAAEIVRHTQQPTTSQFLKENFLQSDGTPYSDKACGQARDYANTKSIKPEI